MVVEYHLGGLLGVEVGLHALGWKILIFFVVGSNLPAYFGRFCCNSEVARCTMLPVHPSCMVQRKKVHEKSQTRRRAAACPLQTLENYGIGGNVLAQCNCATSRRPLVGERQGPLPVCRSVKHGGMEQLERRGRLEIPRPCPF